MFEGTESLTIGSWTQPAAAFASCAAAGLLLGKPLIAWLSRRFREPIKSISPTVMRLHAHKSQTPTMGGMLIVATVVAAGALGGIVADPQVALALAAMIGFSLVGALDDLVKLYTARRGLSAATKLVGQFAVATATAYSLAWLRADIALLPLARDAVLLVAIANAVNLTDGLDGLASGCTLIASIALAVVFTLAGVTNLSLLAAALGGAAAAFFWFNRYPARVFMGDTGSQAIGAVLGYLAIASGSSLVVMLICGVFLVELASVVLQLASYRIRGKRLFLCAPLHHHFQFAGWAEPRIVRAFLTVAIAFAAVGILVASRPPQTRIADFSRTAGNLIAAARVSQEP